MKPQPLGRSTIARLNSRARAIARTNKSLSVSLDQAATEAGLSVLKSDEQVVLYRSPAGRLVNCWTLASNGVGEFIGEGGLGFDDQIDLIEEHGEV